MFTCILIFNLECTWNSLGGRSHRLKKYRSKPPWDLKFIFTLIKYFSWNHAVLSRNCSSAGCVPRVSIRQPPDSAWASGTPSFPAIFTVLPIVVCFRFPAAITPDVVVPPSLCGCGPQLRGTSGQQLQGYKDYEYSGPEIESEAAFGLAWVTEHLKRSSFVRKLTFCKLYPPKCCRLPVFVVCYLKF